MFLLNVLVMFDSIWLERNHVKFKSKMLVELRYHMQFYSFTFLSLNDSIYLTVKFFRDNKLFKNNRNMECNLVVGSICPKSLLGDGILWIKVKLMI